MALSEFKLDIDTDGIATATFDMPGKSMNVWNEKAIADFSEIVDQFVTDASIKGLVVTSGKDSFCAGADLTMLALMKHRVEGIARQKGEQAAKRALFEDVGRLGGIFRKMETAKKPVVAAITGTALGGGLEVCLAAHRRIAADNPKTKLGLPEVKVGLIPGAGGTQRLPRMISAQDALQIVIQGQELRLDKALAMKIVDEVVPAKKLIATAKAWIKANPTASQPWDQDKFKLPGGPVYSAAGMQMWPAANAIYRRETYDNYPAAKAILQAMYEGLLMPFDLALRIEARYFAYAVSTPEAAAMIRSLFVSMGELNKGARRPADVKPTKFKSVGVIGAGFMGAGIAHVTAKAGIDVILVDRDQESADKGKAGIQKTLDEQVMKGRLKMDDRNALLARITTSADYASLSGVDLVVEAVFESRDVKKDVTEKTQAAIRPNVVFASNTSTLPITSLAKNFKRQKDFIGIHFFSPVDKMLLVEIIMGKKTGPKALAVALDYVKAIKKTPIVVNDTRGFFANRCVGNYVREGHIMLAEGVPPAMIETLAKMAGMPVGPLSLNDEVAIDLAWKILQATKTDLGEKAVDPRQEKLLEEMVIKRGRLGRKNGMGFYDYPKGGKKMLWPGLAEICPPKPAESFDREELMKRFLVVQAVEAVRCVEEVVVTDMREADVGSILGFGFAPFTGGVISYVDQMGAENFLALCEYYTKKYGKRFKPPKLLAEMAEKGETFYGRFQATAPASAKQAA
jgi:3-hydroxyacyl-CoA dehydrogenase/enoyl-CoA hydratase/3-hydroxybutyryl-CoA epimerase